MLNNMKKILIPTIIVTILALFVYGFYLFFGGTLLYLLGLKYNNLWSLAKFMMIFLILDMIIDFIVVCFLKVLKDLRSLTKTQYNLLYLTLDIPITMVVVGIAETMTKGVSCSMLTAFIFSVISYLFGLVLQKESSKS